MVKVVFLSRDLFYGGAERQLANLVSSIDRSRFQPNVLNFYPGGPLEQDIRNADVPIISLDKRGRWDLLGFFLGLIRNLRRLKPDVLHGYLVVPNILTIFLKPFLPQTRMIWGVRSAYLDLKNYDRLARVLYKVECLLSRFADLIIVNSRAGFKYAVENGFPEKQMIVIPNGIDTDQFKPDPESGKEVRQEWKVQKDEVLIGTIGRLDPIKDHKTFFKAAQLFLKNNPRARFVCLGPGSEAYSLSLKRMVEELGISDRVILWGAREDMRAVYNALDIYCSSSYGEGFSNVICEAMACGVPCVVTDVGDSAWIVGDCGVVVPPKDPGALMAGWEHCLNGKSEQRSAQARSRIEEEFTIQKLVERTEEALWRTDLTKIY